MPINDMYQITHDMTQFGQSQLNVYHVQRNNSGETAGSISDAFQNSILPILRLFQSNTVVSNELRIFNLGVSTDFGTFTLGGALGLRVGSDNPTFLAVTMRFPSRDRDIKAGHKRMGGSLESDIVDGVIDAPTQTLMTNIGNALIANWLASSDSHNVCSYAIIKRHCETVDPVTGECIEYRLPKLDGELFFYLPNAFVNNTDISSQVSRKVF